MNAAPVARRPPYKDFLQPALQRRFAGTAAIVLGLAYLESLTLSHWDSLIWSWLPLGYMGLRVLSFFACVLSIIILRIAQGHIGRRNANSIFEGSAKAMFSRSALETVSTYIVFALFFSQVYLLSTPEEAGIRWISLATGRSRLNEHAVFFTTSLVFLGLVQGVIHVAFDQDRLLLSAVERRPQGDNANRELPSEHWAVKLGERTPLVAIRSGMLAIIIALTNYSILYHFLRLFAWRSSMWFFRFFYSDLPKYNLPPGGAPWSVWMLGRTTWASFLLIFLWSFGEVAFRIQFTREPLKNGQPLTAESRDPNGSLLNGLRSTRSRISAFATWELALIARDFTARRQSIFEDIDRNDGPTWSQIYALCLDSIRGIERRIDEHGRPPAPVAAPVVAPVAGPEPVAPANQPRQRVAQPPRNNDIAAPLPTGRRALVMYALGRAVRSPGKTPSDVLMPKLRDGAVLVANRVMTEEQRAALQPQAIRGFIGALLLQVLALPYIGPIFQQTFNQRLTRAVLSSPYAETSAYINAAYALSRLAVSSLTEDRYGNVQRDVPTIIRTFTTVIRKIEAFRDGLPMHWTDIEQRRECAEVTEVLTALKDGLHDVVEAFGEFRNDLRLSRAEIRLAREAAARQPVDGQPDMQQRR
ncbi:nucleoporin protein Ndc1-Nup [Nemania sp. FL0916]|nr:nucleoporin protein Ndc1-Nup [Nemania sp. FL0916]